MGIRSPSEITPFSYFGNKQRVGRLIWERFGSDLTTFIDPFFGTGSVLFANPTPIKTEVVNDLNGFVVNFFRAAKYAPDELEKVIDYPATQIDLYARHSHLRKRADWLFDNLIADPLFFDVLLAGWWVWGANLWIGVWCGRKNTHWQRPSANRKCGFTMMKDRNARQEYLQLMASRLRDVTICCGSWANVLPDHLFTKHSHEQIGVFLDPPYLNSHRVSPQKKVYYKDNGSIAKEVKAWAVSKTETQPNLKVIMCGVEGEHEFPDGWDSHVWEKSPPMGFSKAKVKGTYPNECVWFSPSCKVDTQLSLFD